MLLQCEDRTDAGGFHGRRCSFGEPAGSNTKWQDDPISIFTKLAPKSRRSGDSLRTQSKS